MVDPEIPGKGKHARRSYYERVFVSKKFDSAIEYDYDSQVNRVVANRGDAIMEIYATNKGKDARMGLYGVYCGPESLNNREGNALDSLDGLYPHQVCTSPSSKGIILPRANSSALLCSYSSLFQS